MKIFNLIKVLFQLANIQYIIKYVYPHKYPTLSIKSIINENILNKCENIFIEENVIIKNHHIKIGKHTYIGNNTFIDSCSFIGAFCSISSDVKIGMRNHPLGHISTSPIFYSSYRSWLNKSTFNESEQKSVTIEEDVLISASVIIINGVKIGRGAVIGAGAVVTKDVPPYSIVGGIPARVIRYRFNKDTIEIIEKSQWWLQGDKSLKLLTKLSNNPKLFISKLNQCSFQ